MFSTVQSVKGTFTLTVPTSILSETVSIHPVDTTGLTPGEIILPSHTSRCPGLTTATESRLSRQSLLTTCAAHLTSCRLRPYVYL